MKRNFDQPIFKDGWEDDFDKKFERAAKATLAVWIGGLLLTLAFWGVVVWAIIALVSHFTS